MIDWPERLRRVFAVCTLASLAAAFVADYAAAAPSLQVETTELRSTVDYTFGQVMRFNLVASGIGDVEAVTLYFRLGTSRDSFAVDLQVAPGTQAEASYVLDLTQTRLPPFTPITYWWDITRSDGTILRVPEQVLSYVDDQFNWRQLVETDATGGGSIRVHYTGEDNRLGEQALATTLEMLKMAGPRLPMDQVLPFDVYIYPSTADLGAALRLAGREFEPGQTYPDLGVILATVVNPETAEQELRDELARGVVDLLLYQALGQDAGGVPAWLRQGLVESLRGQDDLVLENSLRSAFAAGDVIPLMELCAASEIRTDLELAQSKAMVNFILTNYGEDAMRELVSAFAGGADCAAAFQAAVGMGAEQFGGTWLRSLSSVTSERPLAAYAVWSVLLIAGFGLAALLLMRPRRS